MSAQVPRVAGGATLGAITATNLPNTGPGDFIVQIAAFVAIFMLSWYLADRFYNRSRQQA